jgi:Zn-dependent protease/CBS domain-containing protein
MEADMATHSPTWQAHDGTVKRERQPALDGRWAWSIGRLFGIDIRVHATFLILLAWVAASHWMHGHGASEVVGGVAYVLAVFAIVVMHELGHALVARRFGIATRDVTLLPIGGVARLERMPSDPKQELLVAIAGPAVNVALAVLLFGAIVAFGSMSEVLGVAFVGGPLFAKLMWTNVGLAVFNLIPAFPMDGGRVLRAALAMRRDYVRATDIAASVGQAVALGFGLFGLFTNPFLVFIALFVWIGAQAEATAAHVHAGLAGVPVTQAMVMRFATLSPDALISAAAESMTASFQDGIPIVDGSRLVGMLTREDILRAALDDASSANPVAGIMQRDVATVSEDESLDVALDRLQAAGRRSIPVVRGDELVGLLPVQNVVQILHRRERARLAHTLG